MKHGLWFWLTGLAALQHVGPWFPDQGLNPRPLHCKPDSQPLDHQGSPLFFLIALDKYTFICLWSLTAELFFCLFCSLVPPQRLAQSLAQHSLSKCWWDG